MLYFLDYSFGTKIFPHMISFLLTKGIRQLVNGRVWALRISVTSANEDSTTMETTRAMEMTTGSNDKGWNQMKEVSLPPSFFMHQPMGHRTRNDEDFYGECCRQRAHQVKYMLRLVHLRRRNPMTSETTGSFILPRTSHVISSITSWLTLYVNIT